MQSNHQKRSWTHWLIPTLGSTCLTLLIIGTLFWFQAVEAGVQSRMTADTTVGTTTTIPYQGYLADDNSQPISGQQSMVFSLYNQPTGGSPLWTENRQGADSIQVDEGLFNVMLGNVIPLAQSVITDNDILYLGITSGNDVEMTPRMQLGRVPYAVQALTVLDGSITAEKLSSDIDFNLAMIQGGHVDGSVENDGWTLDTGSGQREYKIPIKFENPFEEAPNIIVGLSRIDIIDSSSQKVFVYASNETKSGFDLVFRTWSTTKVRRITANWIAYPSP